MYKSILLSAHFLVKSLPVIVYVFFDVFNDKEELITQGFKIHRRINIVPLTRVDEETGNSLIGEE